MTVPQAPFRSEPKLQLVVAGSGRDGTMTMARLIGDLARANGQSWHVEHELYANHICNLLSQHYETGLSFYRQVVHDLIQAMPAHAISGTTYQFALEQFADIHGPDLKLIHLKRKDREENIRSLEKIVYYRPAMAINMVADRCRTDSDDYTFRLAAFHFDEMKKVSWEKLPVAERLAWHYDKTHALIEQAKQRFKNTLQVYTEDLGLPETIRAIAEFIDPEWKQSCPAVHLNARTEWQARADENEAIRKDMLDQKD